MGRNGCDILLRPSCISSTQCSFEIDQYLNGVVMFYDRSRNHNTQVFGHRGIPFQSGRLPRKVLVLPGFNDKISMGGVNGDLIQFQLEWHVDKSQLKEAIRYHWHETKDLITNPRKARTLDPTETAPAFGLTENALTFGPAETRLISAISRGQDLQRSSHPGLRFAKREVLGSGTYGNVWQVLDVHCGRFVAMKRIARPSGSQRPAHAKKVRREVELMRRARHVSL